MEGVKEDQDRNINERKDSTDKRSADSAPFCSNIRSVFRDAVFICEHSVLF